MLSPQEKYLDAHNGRATPQQAKWQYIQNPEAFVAGVQFALDEMLASLDIFHVPHNHEYTVATDILERVNRGEFDE